MQCLELFKCEGETRDRTLSFGYFADSYEGNNFKDLNIFESLEILNKKKKSKNNYAP